MIQNVKNEFYKRLNDSPSDSNVENCQLDYSAAVFNEKYLKKKEMRINDFEQK